MDRRVQERLENDMKGQERTKKCRKEQERSERAEKGGKGRKGKAIFSLPPNKMRQIINKKVEQQH